MIILEYRFWHLGAGLKGNGKKFYLDCRKCCAARLICLNGFRMKMVWYFIARLSFMCNQSSWPMNIQDYLMPKLD
ncbi:hypothetical protein AHAS_Ahas09G0248100 [Arachis hypogaea]